MCITILIYMCLFLKNEDLIVWMRTAALPTFRKLYRRVDHSQVGFSTGLFKGPYVLRVEYSKYHRIEGVVLPLGDIWRGFRVKIPSNHVFFLGKV